MERTATSKRSDTSLYGDDSIESRGDVSALLASSVSNCPGSITASRMFHKLHSKCSASVMASTACFDAAYMPPNGRDTRPAIEPTLTMTPAALVAHHRDDRTHDTEQAEHVGVELHEHLVVAALLDRTAQFDSRVVDADVDTSGSLDHFGDGGIDGFDVAHVETEHMEVELFVRRCVMQRLGPLERPHSGEHFVSLPGKGQRGVVAEAARTTGEQNGRHGRTFSYGPYGNGAPP